MIEELTVTIPLELYNKLKTDAQRYRDIADMLYQEASLNGSDKLYFYATSVSEYLKAVDYESYEMVKSNLLAEKKKEEYTNVPAVQEPSGIPFN